jgi:hypothetical protein
MNKVKNLFILTLIVAIVSLGIMACKDKGDNPAAKSHSGMLFAKETNFDGYPSRQTLSVQDPNEEHPSREHPSKEHPK